MNNQPSDELAQSLLEKKLKDCSNNSRRLVSENSVLRKHNMALMHELDAERQKHQQLHNQMQINQYTGLKGYDSLVRMLCSCMGTSDPSLPISHDVLQARSDFAIMVIKLDGQYDLIARTLKGSASEWILYQIATRIQENLGNADHLFHCEDDEFVAIIADRSTQEYSALLQKVHGTLKRHHALAGVRLHVGAHIGLAVYPEHGRTHTSLLHSANIALTEALKLSQPFVMFKETLRQHVVDRMDIQNGILKAIESHDQDMDRPSQFHLVFQPQVTLEQASDKSIRISDINAEVLLRWNHPVRGNISPADFIPIAEETGLIQPLGTWLVYRTAMQLQAWQGTALSDLTLSINVSPRQFLNDQLVSSLDGLIRNNSAIASRLKLEITESSLLDNTESCLRSMHHLRGLGLQFAVDDFGRDYSSLSYLRSLPVNTIKIDKSFITNILSSRHDQAIVRAVVRLAQDLDLKVIVEGVETSKQLDLLIKEGCRTIQGFFFSKPLQVDDFSRFYNKAIHRKLLQTPA